MTMQQIAMRNYVFTCNPDGWDLNLHLITATHRNYIIDTGLGSGSVEPILQFLARQNNTNPLVVINTHHHWDHVWGNFVFAGSPVIAHTKCRQILQRQWQQDLDAHQNYISGEVHQCLPNITFDSELCFAEDGIQLFYTPGHTIDGISVYDSVDKVLNAGDNVGDSMEDILPELDCGEDVFRATLARYAQLDFTACVSGHNKVLGKEVLTLMQNEM